MNEWDRGYIEHLIRRDTRIQAEEEKFWQDHQRELFAGKDRYYWDIGTWPAIQGVKSHHEYLVTVCPSCHTHLQYSLQKHHWDNDIPQHAPGCEFFREEQRQWVDDYAELKAGNEVIRPPTNTECLLLSMFRLVLRPTAHICYQRYYVTVESRDGQLVRTVIPHTNA